MLFFASKVFVRKSSLFNKVGETFEDDGTHFLFTELSFLWSRHVNDYELLEIVLYMVFTHVRRRPYWSTKQCKMFA